MEIEIIKENKKRFLDLLLLADEQESMIDQYLERGELFALYDGDLKSICVVTQEDEDLFELKVQIIRKMATLHPSGDWMGWGARALDNPRTATGEEDLAKLHKMLDDLQSRNEQSATFWRLVERVRLRADEDQNSAS